jgi:hypothetical protein
MKIMKDGGGKGEEGGSEDIEDRRGGERRHKKTKLEVPRCQKTHDLVCAEVENSLCSYVGRCSRVRKDDGHVQTFSNLPIIVFM